MPAPSGLVMPGPIGSSMWTSSAISSSHPCLSWAWTHLHDALEATRAGWFSFTPVPSSLSDGAGSPRPVLGRSSDEPRSRAVADGVQLGDPTFQRVVERQVRLDLAHEDDVVGGEAPDRTGVHVDHHAAVLDLVDGDARVDRHPQPVEA